MTTSTAEESIKFIIELPLIPSRAWSYWLEPDLRARWWSPEVMLEGKLYGKFIEPWRDEAGNVVITRGEVIDIKPPELLRFTWEDPGWSSATLVTLTIKPFKKGSRLELEHSGWEYLRAESRFALRKAHAQGWENLLGRLAKTAVGA
jgi:uncharacterized protein YndB with AHSA1/START domain